MCESFGNKNLKLTERLQFNIFFILFLIHGQKNPSWRILFTIFRNSAHAQPDIGTNQELCFNRGSDVGHGSYI